MSLPYPLKGTVLTGQTGPAEEAMRISALRLESNDIVLKRQYQDCAKRVVFYNCMTHCEIAPESIPNFNSNFYYNMLKE